MEHSFPYRYENLVSNNKFFIVTNLLNPLFVKRRLKICNCNLTSCITFHIVLVFFFHKKIRKFSDLNLKKNFVRKQMLQLGYNVERKIILFNLKVISSFEIDVEPIIYYQNTLVNWFFLTNFYNEIEYFRNGIAVRRKKNVTIKILACRL